MSYQKTYDVQDLTEAIDRSWVSPNEYHIAPEDAEIIIHAAAAWEGFITGTADVVENDTGFGVQGVMMPGEAE